MLENSLIHTLRESGWERLYPQDSVRITVGMASCGLAAGAEALYDTLKELCQELAFPVNVEAVGCLGMCWKEPLVEVHISGLPRALYQEVDEAACISIVKSLKKQEYSTAKRAAFSYRDWAEGWNSWIDLAEGTEDDLWRDPFMAGQLRRVSASWGHIVPWQVEEYCALGGYGALLKAQEMNPCALISLVESSGLRGRGGAGYPTGKKWRLATTTKNAARFLIANADEGDPGAYMDRALIESDPHRLIEGMLIAACALRAKQGFIFTRAEYPHAIKTLKKALDEAHAAGILPFTYHGGAHNTQTKRSFDITVVQSAGAYVCGEESALIEVLEGRRPDPQKRPPYPSEEGLLKAPTCINNVETLANIPSILLHGAERFKEQGTAQSPGTKIFSLAGSIERPGLVEVPFGTSVKQLVCSLAGIEQKKKRNVVSEDKKDLSLQIGGPSGSILPLRKKDLTLDYESLSEAGSILGSGGIVVLGHLTCVLDVVRYFLDFSSRESCGQCRACREGLAEASEILGQVCEGHAGAAEVNRLEELVALIPKGSRCALGKMAVNPLKSALAEYQNEFDEHLSGTCKGLVCKKLMHFEVIQEACPGCLCCLPSCPTGAIKGRYGKPFSIDQEKCIKCWMCVSQCPYPALMAFPLPAGGAQVQEQKLAQAEDTPSIAACTNEPELVCTDTGAPATPYTNPQDLTRPTALKGCILCGRCITACREQGGVAALFFRGTGSSRLLVKPSYKGQSDCTNCGACKRICPTQAIEALPYTDLA